MEDREREREGGVEDRERERSGRQRERGVEDRERERSGREKVRGKNHTLSNILIQLILIQLILIQSPSWDILRSITIFKRKKIYSTRYPNEYTK